MDSKSAIEAVEAIRGTVPVQELASFDAELAVRWGLASETVGTVAVSEVVATPEAELKKRLPDFLDANIKLDVTEQLTVMDEFWKQLGFEVPALGSVLTERLEAVVAAHPDRRVVPTPLLDLGSRRLVAEAAKAKFGKSAFNPDISALWTPDTSWVYGKLLADPESSVRDGRKDYGLFYRTPDGELAKRANYTEALLIAGSAVKAEDGTVWTFPVVDAQVNAPRTNGRADELLAQTSPTNTPETQLTIRLLHQANGTPNDTWQVDIVNEAVYELDRKGNPVAPVYVASVYWYPGYRRLYLNYWSADFRDGIFGVRAEESGI